MNSRLRIIISGFVQGVGYRYFAVHQANSLGLKGYVKNISCGNVEAVAEGPAADIEQFVMQLKDGPAAARVEKVQTYPEPFSNEFKTFSIQY
jgi:acylphosphatase